LAPTACEEKTMATKAVLVRLYPDGTLTVKVGRAIEHFDTTVKSKSEIFDAVKWSMISKGISMDNIALTELLQEVLQ
jgi:hypothetical protein